MFLNGIRAIFSEFICLRNEGSFIYFSKYESMHRFMSKINNSEGVHVNFARDSMLFILQKH